MLTRRHFLKNSTFTVSGLLASSLVADAAGQAASGPTLRVGLIGCGGRGTGAARDALQADANVRLVAMGDAFADRIESSLEALQKTVGPKLAVEPSRRFVGLDAYQKVIDSGVDVVLLVSPPPFRPEHLRAAVAAGKHIFCEKPMAVDAAGVRSVLETAQEAKRKRLSLVSGFCWRYDPRLRASVEQMRKGAIGDIRAIFSTYHTGTHTTKFPGTRPAGQTDLEWQLRNWGNFLWLYGEQIVEQAVHNVDKIAWFMNGELPARAIALGGRQVPIPVPTEGISQPSYGNTQDHISVTYEYASGARAELSCRRIDGCFNQVGDYVLGSKGVFNNTGPAARITGETNWRYTGKPGRMYQVEHDELFASIRAGEPLNDGEWMAHSTMMAIMGRMAAHTGQAVTWEQAINSKESLVPEKLDWNMTLPVPPAPVPGKYKLV